MERQEFPKAKYNAKEQPRLVESREAEIELGDEWFDHPDDVKKPKPPKPAKPADPAKP